MTVRKVSRADRRLANLIVFLESKLSSQSEKVQAQAVDRLSEILLKQLEVKAQREERADRAAERDCRLKLAAFKTSDVPTVTTPEEALALVDSLKSQAVSNG